MHRGSSPGTCYDTPDHGILTNWKKNCTMVACLCILESSGPGGSSLPSPSYELSDSGQAMHVPFLPPSGKRGDAPVPGEVGSMEKETAAKAHSRHSATAHSLLSSPHRVSVLRQSKYLMTKGLAFIIEGNGPLS